MKKSIHYLLIALLVLSSGLKAQKIDSIFIHLYTDSLKKGTYNYINVDGLLSNGKYLPLDSTHLNFSSSYGKFYGNSLLLDQNCKEEKVNINISLKANPSLHKSFVMYVKKKDDNERLPTSEEILERVKKEGKRGKG